MNGTQVKKDFSLYTGLLKTATTDDGRMTMTGVASSTIKDRHGDTMTANALQSMLRSADGLTIYLNHSYDVPEDVAGTVTRAWITNDAGELHDLHFEIDINDENPRAVQAWRAIDKGTKLGLSIGAMIPEGGAKRVKGSGAYLIDDVELLETSIVSIPANPRSWVDNARKSLLTKDGIPEIELDGDQTHDELHDQIHDVLKDGEDDPTTAPEPVEFSGADLVASLHVCTDECDPETNTHVDTIPDGGEPVAAERSDALANAAAMLASYTEPDVTTVGQTSTTTVSGLDLEKNKVTVWPSGKVSVDTSPSSQEAAPEAEPGTEEPNADALSAALGEMAKSIDPALSAQLGPTFMATLETTRALADLLADQLTKALDAKAEAERQRDEVSAAAAQLTEATSAFIARVSAYPRGRRAVTRELPQTAKALEGIRESGLFSDEFMDLMTKGATTQ